MARQHHPCKGCRTLGQPCPYLGTIESEACNTLRQADGETARLLLAAGASTRKGARKSTRKAEAKVETKHDPILQALMGAHKSTQAPTPTPVHKPTPKAKPEAKQSCIIAAKGKLAKVKPDHPCYGCKPTGTQECKHLHKTIGIQLCQEMRSHDAEVATTAIVNALDTLASMDTKDHKIASGGTRKSPELRAKQRACTHDWKLPQGDGKAKYVLGTCDKCGMQKSFPVDVNGQYIRMGLPTDRQVRAQARANR